MRAERVFGAIGLGLFFLFPLVSLLQLGDGDEAWRAVAGRASQSVLLLSTSDDPAPLGSAVVLQARPPRAVMASVAPTGRLRSVTTAGAMTWTPCYIDPHGRFTILAGDVPVLATAAADRPVQSGQHLSGLVPVATTVLDDAAAPERDSEPITAVLATPAHLAGQAIWVGELHATRVDGDAVYLGERLRALRDPDGTAAARSTAAAIDPVLCGAPFVTREGAVVALYLGTAGGASTALPMLPVRDALAALDHPQAR